MDTAGDYRIRDLGRVIITLRRDLGFSPRHEAGEPIYVIEDAINSRFFRIGMSEYTFISLLDGSRSVAEAISIMARTSPTSAFTEQDAATTCKWLLDNGLASTPESNQAEPLVHSARQREQKRWSSWNPVCFRIPLCYPDRCFACVQPWLEWIHSPVCAVISLPLIVWSLVAVSGQWDRFVSSTAGILAPERWLLIGACWLVLKLVHEASHGMVCKRYGGSVHEAGIMLVLFAPIAYVDVTSSWRFRSKWARIHTALAGMHVELWIASIAALVWSITDSGRINDVCFNVVIMASVTTLIFNANPLMRFDGYYVASDLLEIPNLYSSGQQFLRYLVRRYVVGVPALPPQEPGVRGAIVRCYAVASFVWRVFVCTCLLLAACRLFHGAGIVIAVAAVVAWLVLPAVRFIRETWYGDSWEKPRSRRFVWTMLSGLAVITIVLAFCPWPGSHRAPAIVEYAPLTVVRAASPGFVREIFVHSGERIEKDQVIAVLENEELKLESESLRLVIQQHESRAWSHHQRAEMAAYQAELRTVEGLNKRLHEKQREVDNLVVRAPVAGQVVTSNLSLLQGTFVKLGEEIVSLGDETRKEIQIAIAQEDVEAFGGHLGHSVSVRLRGGDVLLCSLIKVVPRARLDPLHPSLCAPNGGPLPVKPRLADDPSSPEHRFELLTPRFTGIAALSGDVGHSVHAGQRASVWFGRGRQTVGSFLYRGLRRWLLRQPSLAEGTG